MEDSQIVALYFERNEKALSETAVKYEKYCYAIAYGILNDEEDARESVNDTLLDAWNSIPPNRPSVLRTFLGKLSRRIAIDKWRQKNADKRGGGQIVEALEELAECIPNGSNPEQEAEENVLNEIINAFVRELPETEQKVFLCRYWYMDSVKSVAKQFGFTESKVKSMLARTRLKLEKHLSKEDFI